jgi:hypothetical protein
MKAFRKYFCYNAPTVTKRRRNLLPLNTIETKVLSIIRHEQGNPIRADQIARKLQSPEGGRTWGTISVSTISLAVQTILKAFGGEPIIGRPPPINKGTNFSRGYRDEFAAITREHAEAYRALKVKPKYNLLYRVRRNPQASGPARELEEYWKEKGMKK